MKAETVPLNLASFAPSLNDDTWACGRRRQWSGHPGRAQEEVAGHAEAFVDCVST